jgi:alpha-beta hydrolase superfamily lysophospholipase
MSRDDTEVPITTVSRSDVSFDVSAVLPSGASERHAELTATVVARPETVDETPTVVIAIPGGTYHRRYWDMHPPGRRGYSKAEYLAERGVIFIAMDYLGGGDSSRPADGDFIGLETQADAAHLAFLEARDRLRAGSLVDDLPPIPSATFVGIGQSLGGFITMIQQGKYDDYPAVGIFGASPLLIAGTREQPDWDSMSGDERRRWITEANTRQSGSDVELPMYHGAPREQFQGIFHVPDVAEDLVRYDEEQCHTLIPRFAGVDGMTPGFAKPFADRISRPVFLAFGQYDVAADAHCEPAGYPASADITVVVFPNMAHMHNFADTRTQLWDRFLAWLPIVKEER